MQDPIQVHSEKCRLQCFWTERRDISTSAAQILTVWFCIGSSDVGEGSQTHVPLCW